MASTIPLLRKDHINFQLLLNVLEHQLSLVDGEGAPNTALLKMILAYFRDYPRKVHHPKEDLIYSELLLRMPEKSEVMFHAIQDHRELSEHLEAVEQALEAVDPNSPGSLETLGFHLRALITREREHMTLEEAHLYPCAVHRLTPEQWEKIDRYMANDADPLFGDAVAAPYERLKDAILSLDKVLRSLE